MVFPEKIPIERIEDYHTHYLGSTSHGKLFWGYATYVYTVPYSSTNHEENLKNRRDYVVLHLFDKEGNYLSSKSHIGETGIPLHEEQENKILNGWMNELGAVDYHDIEIYLFETKIDDQRFGLFTSDEYQSIILMPSYSISFIPPWDGSYFT